MNRTAIKSKFLHTVSVAGILAGAAVASVPGWANAQEADAGAMLEEITVTARRQSESLQSVPVAVSAFSGAEMEKLGIEDITELQQRVPNTTLQVSRGTNSTLTAYIRGIGQQDPLWGFEPGVGIYIDDVYVARPQGAVLDILDVQNIEVLRGPQGTLYGKNTIGGALKYVTKRLSGETELSVDASYGTYNQMDLKATAQTALVEDKVNVGVGFATLNRDGFGEFVNTGDENYNKSVIAVRGTIEIMPSDSLFIRIAGDYTDDDSNAKGGYRLTPSIVTDDVPLDDIFNSNTSMPVNNEVKTKGVSMTAEYTVNDNTTLKSITAYREGDTYTNIDFDNTDAASLDVPAIYDDDQFTQELQLSYSDENLNLVGGLYYYTGDACGVFDVILSGAAFTLENGGCVDTESYSAYAQGSYNLTDKLALSLGGRYTHDKKSANVYRYVYLGPKYPNDDLGDPFGVQSDFTGEESWNKFTPHVGLDYQVNDDVLVYAKFSSGFKSGGFDMRGNQSVNPSADDPFDPETVDSYEIGLKTEFWDGRARVNIAAFYNDYKDMQVTVQRSVGDGSDFASQVLNAANAETKGIELEASFAMTEELTLSASMGYIDAEFKEVIFFNPNTGMDEDVSDTWSISNTPDFSSNVNLTYETMIGEWNMILTGSWSYRSSTQIFEVPSPLDMGSYSLFNVGASFTSPDEKWVVSVHGKNIFDKEYRIAGYNFPATFNPDGTVAVPGLGGEDTVVGYYGDPATVTFTVGFRF